MLSPDGFGEKAKAAPSIWSFDSGYGTQEEASRNNGAFYLQASTSTNSLQQRLDSSENLPLGLGLPNFQVRDRSCSKFDEGAIEPIVTKLSVFTTSDNCAFHNDFFLPEITSNGESSCLTCEFWRITNPGENTQCEDCRMAGTIEPSLLLADDDKGKAPVRSVERSNSRKNARSSIPDVAPHTRCSACELSALINPSGPSSCSSCSPSFDLLSPVSPPVSDFKVRRSRAGRNSKLPLSALSHLQSWLDAHQDNPYPSKEVKKQLAQECGITEKQVTTWFTNARARQLNAPQLTPLDTWLSSGSEDEGAEQSDIASAAQTPAYTTGMSFLSDNKPSGYRRAGSISGSSAFSASQARLQPSRRGKKKNYRRNVNNPPQIIEQSPPQTANDSLSPTGEQDMWQCTFCHRHLVPKSWRRHEETQHRPRAQWTCMLFGPRLSFPHRPGSCCAFCMAKDPSEDHFLEHHRITECAKRPIGERTFFRPDHLRQHVKNFHGATLYDIAQTRWKRGPTEVGKSNEGQGWTCGFCAEALETWDKRETHIANHFKEGMTMAQWKDYRVKEESNNEKDARHEEMASRQEKVKEKHHSLAGLGRSLTRRLTRSSKASSSASIALQQPQQPQQHESYLQPQSSAYQQPRQQMAFANAFEQLPVSTSPMCTMDQTFSAAPVLPDINMEPLMGSYNTANYIDWNQVTAPQQYNHGNLVYDPSQFVQAQAEYDSTFVNFANQVEYHGPWNPQ